jgi:hypothetical protein
MCGSVCVCVCVCVCVRACGQLRVYAPVRTRVRACARSRAHARKGKGLLACSCHSTLMTLCDPTPSGVVQMMLDSLLLSEGSYKVIDSGGEGARRIMADALATLPAELVSIRHLQWSREHVQHR